MPLNVVVEADQLKLQTGMITRVLNLSKWELTCTKYSVQDVDVIKPGSFEFKIHIFGAQPNERPIGLTLDQAGSIEQENKDIDGTDGLTESESKPKSDKQNITWHSLIHLSGENVQRAFTKVQIDSNENRLQIQWSMPKAAYLDGLELLLIYEMYPTFPVIRKWIELKNTGEQWLKIDQLVVEPLELLPEFRQQTPLTPSERGATASLTAFHNKEETLGLIFGSEVPSVLRTITDSGTMGYNPSFFEWVVGPGENFVSEPVWEYGFAGEVIKFPSGKSKPLDRTVENELQRFFTEILKIPAATTQLPGPVWCSWSNLVSNINDEEIRIQAEIAARCGFSTFQIDAGWSLSPLPSDWTAGGTEPNPEKFPQFPATCTKIQDLNMYLGLWLSCFRPEGSKDLQDVPDGRSIPLIKRGTCYGMSFSSRWRDYYIQDVIELTDRTHATYYKQDLTNIKFGDIAEGHESRTRKESYLRGLRGLLKSQSDIHSARPQVWTMLSHEIYWGTPGVPCDLAIIKSTCGFHIPPNDYSGCGPRKQRWQPTWDSHFGRARWELRKGCINARNRFYAHRGLPLYICEYYGAATINIGGALTTEIQDRQICSWLMGQPSVFAGDLVSLTPENIEHYQKRFQLLKELQSKYDIFHHFQYSGVPEPTDWGWHWWGKLNPNSEGAVVILRGQFGAGSQAISIPWVITDNKYHIFARLIDKDLGILTGTELQQGKLILSLPRWGQEILEIAAVK
jgi:hypothetical protein